MGQEMGGVFSHSGRHRPYEEDQYQPLAPDAVPNNQDDASRQCGTSCHSEPPSGDGAHVSVPSACAATACSSGAQDVFVSAAGMTAAPSAAASATP